MVSQFIAAEDELFVEVAGMVGFDRLSQLVLPNGALGLPPDELRAELDSIGYLAEWHTACQAAARRYGYPDSYLEIEESARHRNQLFLSLVAKDMRLSPSLSLV